MEPAQAIRILGEQIGKADALRDEGAYSPARERWINTCERALIGAVGDHNSTLQRFHAAQSVFTYPGQPDSERREQANDTLEQIVAIMESSIEELSWKLSETQRQILFPVGSQHDAFVEIRNVISKVKTEVLIVDSFVDGTLWALLKNVPHSASIRILTAHPKADFAVEGQAFKKQHGNRVEVRTTNDFHDRFIFVDAGGCWHLGASIKDAGAKVFLFSEIVDPKNEAAVRKNAEDTWNAGAVLNLTGVNSGTAYILRNKRRMTPPVISAFNYLAIKPACRTACTLESLAGRKADDSAKWTVPQLQIS